VLFVVGCVQLSEDAGVKIEYQIGKGIRHARIVDLDGGLCGSSSSGIELDDWIFRTSATCGFLMR
jgi:hypothetical protein